jgi:two-component system alkaline phosphatase synthesis response regulator PhoP
MAKILIVEDDNILSAAVDTALKNAGFETLVATDGVDALKKAYEFVPDLILLDLLMPKKPGEDVLSEIRNDGVIKNVPIIVSSVKSDPEAIAKCTAMGVSGYLVKAHYTLDEIVAMVKKVLGVA